MDVTSLRADGWQDAVAFPLIGVVAVFFWYTHDFYTNWMVFVAGIGVGPILYVALDALETFDENHSVAGLPFVLVFVVVMVVMVRSKSLVAGFVAAWAVTTVMKVSEVYL